ncbi:MAG: SDR family oxidoreductase [Anaerolineae bacterium]|nr:SDR family oxidoreductase [Anaerolineae bacterium]
MRLKDKVAIVTGGSRGIGRAIALRLGQEGAKVAVVHLRGPEGEEVAQQIRQNGSAAIAIHCDVSDSQQVQAMVARVVQEWGTIDILVNNAAICPFKPFMEISEALWDQVLDTNLKGYFLCSQAVARVMIEQGVRGRIIAVSSISSEFGGSQQAHYCASKAGINLLIKSMAIALGPYGITCNAVLPGTVETDINRAQLADPEVRAYWSRRAPLGRIGKPEDIAGPVVFFASDDAAWCTGAMLVVDGGVSVNLQ